MAEKNEIKIVRAVVKLSSMLQNLDSVKDNYTLPKKMFRDLSNFDNWFDENTNTLMVELFKHKPELLEEMISWFNDYDKRYTVEESLGKQITLFRAKCFSAIYDLTQINIPKDITDRDVLEIEISLAKFALIVSSRLNAILDKGYFKRLPFFDNDFANLYESMNELGDKIMGGE